MAARRADFASLDFAALKPKKFFAAEVLGPDLAGCFTGVVAGGFSDSVVPC